MLIEFFLSWHNIIFLFSLPSPPPPLHLCSNRFSSSHSLLLHHKNCQVLPSRAPSSPNSSITNSDWSAGLLCPGGRRRGSPGITWNPAALLARKGKRGLIGVLSDFSSVLRSVYSRTYSSTDRMGECPVNSCRSPFIGVETSLRRGGCLLIPVGPSLPSSNQLLDSSYN